MPDPVSPGTGTGPIAISAPRISSSSFTGSGSGSGSHESHAALGDMLALDPPYMSAAAPLAPSPSPRRGSFFTARSNASSSGRGTPASATFAASRAGAKGKAKAGEEMEMIQFSTTLDSAPTLERKKTDDALLKWRKWVVDHPPDSSESSPLALKDIGLPHHGPISGPSTPRNIAPLDAPTLLRSQSDPTSESSSPNGPTTPGELDIYNTESILILRDVELAIDPTYQSRHSPMPSGGHGDRKRQMSTLPRISSRENPMAPIASRLASRRVRPIVLELIHALGHYIDAVWAHRRPGEACPWVTGPAARYGVGPPGAARTWTSKMISAVQDGKALGYVGTPPSPADLAYWRDEVAWALADVTAIVGIMKGSGWAFIGALSDGEYGKVEDDNVLDADGEGGSMVRLLNDLEEALWGDAPPRASDLAWELPLDFDPYAQPDPEELSTGLNHRVGEAPTPVLAFLSNSSSVHSELVASPDAVGTEQMPDLVHIAGPASPTHDLQTPPAARSGTDGSYWGFSNAEGMSWEEIGKKRHQEWLASRQASVAST